MSLNIIVRDKRPDKTQRRDDTAKGILRGYRDQENDGNLRKKSARETNAIKRGWETFVDSGL